MTQHRLPYFGNLPIEELADYYDVDAQIAGHKIRIDLNFKNTRIDAALFDAVKNLIEHIEKFNRQNLVCIQRDFANHPDSVVSQYVAFHIEELGDEFLAKINVADTASDKAQQCLAKLHLTRVGLYPDGQYDASCFAVFDYTLGRDVTDELIVVSTDAAGNVEGLCSES